MSDWRPYLLSQATVRILLSQTLVRVSITQQTEATRLSHGPLVSEPFCGRKLVSKSAVFRDLEDGRTF